ncbi:MULTISPECIES: hypothetical protein [unclassified Mucilaginibacter]|uniref:hypothetical protein n=1 Tax=unclassified Mucilaginibacter TaxID=2617802 RepID=UPI0031F65140
MKTLILVLIANLFAGICLAQTVLYKKDGIAVLYKNETLKKVYCSDAKKDIYLVESSVYILNATGRSAYFSGAVFTPEEAMISGNCVSQGDVDSLGEYLTYFDAALVKGKNKIVKVSRSWVLTPDYTPDWSISKIDFGKIEPYSFVNKSGLKNL